MMIMEEKRVRSLFLNYEQNRIEFSNRLRSFSNDKCSIKWIEKYNGIHWISLMLQDVPPVKSNALNIVCNLCLHSPEMCAEVCNQQLLQLILENNDNTLSTRVTIFSIFENIIKHKENKSRTYRFIEEYDLFDRIKSHLNVFELKLLDAALTLLLVLSKQGEDLCSMILGRADIMALLYGFCTKYSNQDIVGKTVRIFQQLCCNCPDSELVQPIIRCLFTLLNRDHSNFEVPFLAIQGISVFNKSKLHTASLIECGIVDILQKYSECLAENLPGVLLVQAVSEYPDTCTHIMENGLVEAVVSMLHMTDSHINIHAVYTIGNLAKCSSKDALVLIEEKCVVTIIDTLLLRYQNPDAEMLEACIYALENLCKFSPRHLKPFQSRSFFSYFNNLYKNNILEEAIGNMFVQLLPNCSDLETLEKLFLSHMTSSDLSKVFESVLDVYCQVLPFDKKARKLFVNHDLLRLAVRVRQQIQDKARRASSDAQHFRVAVMYNKRFDKILSCFPIELVRYYDPHYEAFILSRLDLYESDCYSNNCEE